MTTNAVQMLVALGAATLSLSVLYTVAIIFWLKWKLEGHTADKAERARYRVINKRWGGNGQDANAIARGATASAYIGSIGKSKKRGSSHHRPKWQRFRVAHELTIITDNILPVSSLSDGQGAADTPLSRSSTSPRFTSPQHSQRSQHSPYAVISPTRSVTCLRSHSSGSMASDLSAEIFALPVAYGIIKPSTISKRMTDTIRYNLTNAGIRVVKRSRKHKASPSKLRAGLSTGSPSKTQSGMVAKVAENMTAAIGPAGATATAAATVDKAAVTLNSVATKKTAKILEVTLTKETRLRQSSGGGQGGWLKPSTVPLEYGGFMRSATLGTKIFETMSMRAPYLVKATTTSLQIKWEPWIVGNEKSLKHFEISWRVVSGQSAHALSGWTSSDPKFLAAITAGDLSGIGGGSGSGSFGGSVSAGESVRNAARTAASGEIRPHDHYEIDACEDSFTPIPQDTGNNPDLKQKITIHGLPASCPLVEFRVRSMMMLSKTPGVMRRRGRSGFIDGGAVLWGPYSVVSNPLQTLASTVRPPSTGAITSGAIELRWGPPRDPRYGRTDGYTLMGKKAGTDTFVNVRSGARVHSCSIRAVNSIPLTADTTYVFKLIVRTSAGELVSNSLPVTTLPAPPDTPMPPTVVRTTARTIELHWTAPSDNGSPITRYVLYGRRHRTSRFKRLYTGTLENYVCGSRPDGDQLAPDTLYVFKLKAINSYGDSPASSIVTARTTTLSMAEAMNIATGRNVGAIQGSSTPGSPTHGSPTGSGGNGEEKNGDPLSPSHVRRSSGSLGSPSTRLLNSPGADTSATTPASDRLRTSASSPDVSRSGSNLRLSSAPARVSELPNGWVECWDPQREICYYFNSLTGITQWIHPIHGKGGTDPDLEFRKKRFKLLYSLRERDWPQGGRKILKMTLRRSHLVIDSFEAIRRLDASKLKLKTKIIFLGEEGIDSGGLTKEWFLELSRALLDPQRCLFVKLEDSSTKAGSTSYHIDHRSSVNEHHLQYFQFVGSFLAKAIYDRQLVDLPLCNSIYKYLLGRPATLKDLQDMDPVYYKSLLWMLGNDIDDVIFETFTVTVENFGQLQEVELIPGGKEIKVTNANKDRYVQAILDWRTTGSVAQQLRSMRNGFQEVLPTFQVREFTEEEINLLLNGKQNFDVEEMRQATRYTGGYETESSPVKIFWRVVKQLDLEARGKLLQFATGSSKVPLDGYDPCFTITKSSAESGTAALPTSHTCFNQLVLPEYDSEEVMLKKLLFAFENAGGFHMT